MRGSLLWLVAGDEGRLSVRNAGPEYCGTAGDEEPPDASHLTQDSIPVRRPNWLDMA
jgi:hypothetical protein